MVATSMVEEMSKELSQAHTNLLNLQFGFVNAMAIRCAIQLGIPDILHSNGSFAISLSDLASAIPIPPVKAAHLGRLMRLLVHLDVFSLEDSDHEPAYLLNPTSRLLLASDKGSNNVTPYSRMVLDPYLVEPCFYFGDWLKMEGSMPFELCHGGSMWEVAAMRPEFNKGFNAAMASDSQFLLGSIVAQCPHVFQDLQSLIDVGGGIGGSARTIAKAFPHLNVKVLDLPHVAAVMPKDAGVEVIGGDMFKHIPPTDAVFLKWILHDWNDEECVQILRKCKEAVPSKEKGGKVIIVEVVVNSKMEDHKYTQAEYCADVIMMALTTGWERDEQEWSRIFKDAGFKDYKITPGLGVRSLIELYH